MIFQDFTERFSFGVLKSLSKIMKFAFFKVKPCQICEGLLHLELFFLFLKKYKKWKHTYKPNVFCMILMKINVWSGCCYSQIHVLKKKLFRKHSEHPNNFVDFIQKTEILKKTHIFGQFWVLSNTRKILILWKLWFLLIWSPKICKIGQA